jgi:integrase
MTREPESSDHPPDEQQVTDAALALARLFARQAAADMQQTRPALMTRGGYEHDYLWVTNRGAPISDTSMATLIRNQTRKLFGVPISPHLFRDIAATTMARTSPEAVGNIRSLLDHRGHETAEKYYNHATALEIGRNHAQLIDSIRQGD